MSFTPPDICIDFPACSAAADCVGRCGIVRPSSAPPTSPPAPAMPGWTNPAPPGSVSWRPREEQVRAAAEKDHDLAALAALVFFPINSARAAPTGRISKTGAVWKWKDQPPADNEKGGVTVEVFHRFCHTANFRSRLTAVKREVGVEKFGFITDANQRDGAAHAGFHRRHFVLPEWMPAVSAALKEKMNAVGIG